MRDGGNIRKDADVLFDGSFEGFLCIIYAYYYLRINPRYIQEESKYQQALDAEEFYIAADSGRAAQVTEGIYKKISPDAAHYLFHAHLSDEEDIFMDMFRYAILGFTVGAGVDDYLQEDYVMRVHQLAKRVTHEAHILTGFCRFAETRMGVYYCDIAPKNRVLLLLAEHFRDRFMNHAWVIHDKKHKTAAIYDGNEYIIEPVPGGAVVEYSCEEEEMRDLWVTFFNTIGIKERKSYTGQRQHIPLYYRGSMVEFHKCLTE